MSLATATATDRGRTRRRSTPSRPSGRPRGLSWVFASEAVASLLGFVALVHQARRLGPSSFARVEVAAAVAAWLLVLVRGGVDVIVTREAARRPRLVRPLTDLLLGLRLIAAGVGFALVLTLAAWSGGERGALTVVAGTSLLASVWAADVGPRATGRLGPVALAQAVRAIGLAVAVCTLVNGPDDAGRAVGCLAGAEGLGAVVLWIAHARDHGPAWPRWRRRASLTLARRGLIAGLSRFARVTLYGLDLLALGWWIGPELGPYSAARRVVYALLALGLVIPAMLGPSIARAWAHGPLEARRRIGQTMGWLWTGVLPATLGLVLTADRTMPWLFGDDYRRGGPWLVLLAARLPCLLAGSFAQTALVACRRESWCLRLVVAQAACAGVVVPFAAFRGGPWAVGWSILVVESIGAMAGWLMLGRLGVGGRAVVPPRAAWVAGIGLIVACLALSRSPLPLVILAGAAVYGSTWLLASRWVASGPGSEGADA